MKKKVFIAALLGGLTAGQLSAQKYLGLSNSNYSGVYGGQYNPAKLADKKVKLSVNLLSVNVLANNDYYRFKNVGDIADFELSSFGNRFSHDTDKKNLSIGVIGEILGPSFQFTTGNRLGFGFSSRARIFGQGHEVDTAFLDVINQNYTTPISLRNNNAFSLNISGFTDLGVKGAYSVLDNDAVSLSLGAAFKLYRGGVYNSFVSKGYDINYNPLVPSNPLSINNVDWEFYTNFNNNESIDVPSLLGSGSNAATGFGGDFGAELAVKGNNADKPYLFKFGAAVTDIGAIKYKNLNYIAVRGNSLGGIDPNEINFTDLNATANYLQSKGLSVTRVSDKTLTNNLPTSLNLYGEYAISRNFFVGVNALVNVVKTNSTNPYYYNYVGAVPRWESKWFDVAVPLSYNFMSKDFKPGLAFRLGVLSVGSDDLKLLFTESKGANIYAGLHFELFKGKQKIALPPVVEKDTDGDGILDKYDKCPTVAGPAENEGCPWPDSDGDGVLDKDDKCPTVVGPVENEGCPWPDTDGDGVLDKDDKCPTVPGLKENDGCPKTNHSVAEEVTLSLKDILFNFGNATLRPESNEKLDAAAKIIQSSNGGTFLVIGHTDKKGNPAYNLKLSRERAAAVVKALEERGVSENQLKSKGLGSQEATVPVTASDAERQKDRRVEVKFVEGAEWEALKKSDVPVAAKKAVKKGKAPVRKASAKKK